MRDMDYKAYLNELGKIKGSRKNQIIRAVNSKTPKKEFKFKSDVEEKFFDNMMTEAAAHEKKHGFWPTFEMCEIESEDPVLDIYNDAPGK